MATQSETIQVSGIRCERCVQRLAGALTGTTLRYDGVVGLGWEISPTVRVGASVFAIYEDLHEYGPAAVRYVDLRQATPVRFFEARTLLADPFA